ncbi:MAG: ribonuclease domain-containing protein [Candidatus Binatia bacterium]
MRLPICRRYRPALTLYVLALALALLVGGGASCAREPSDRQADQVGLDELPREAHKTLSLIKKDGPFPYQRDGATFGNFERRLPQKERGYYKEYTVPTPGARDRGARRIVAGRKGEFYFTDNHYKTFRRILE